MMTFNLDPEVRMAFIEYADEIAALIHASFAEFRHLYTPEGFALTTPSAEQIRRRWHEGPVWVAVRQGGVVGTISAVPTGATLHLRSMAVLPEFKGMGFARKLLHTTEQYARDHGFTKLDLDTTPFLHDAIALYTKAGFLRTKDHDLGGTPLFGMEKVLR